MSHRKGRLFAGLALILIGVVLYILERSQGIDAAAVFFLVGAAFLAAYFYKGEYGLLVPAGILLGLGTGTIVSQTRFDYGEPTMWGLGLGFVSIYVISLLYERKSHWWPLIPGGVLILIGLPTTGNVVDFLFANWPVALIIVGILILIGGFRAR